MQRAVRTRFVSRRTRLNYAFYEYILWERRTCDIKVTYVPLPDDSEGGDSA